MDNDVREYIENRKISRMPDQDIINELIANGWKQVDAARMVTGYNKDSVAHKSRTAWILLLSLIAVAIVAIAVYIFNYGTPNFINI